MVRFIITFLGILPIISFSQVYAPDFTLTSTDGITFSLHDECAQGKAVILDFFHRNCVSCQNNTPTLDSIWQAHGGNGDSVWVWGIEGVIGPINGTDEQIDSFKVTFGATFPCFSTINDDTVHYLYNIYYTPQYFVVCPDTRMKFTTVDNIGMYLEACFPVTTAFEDPGLSQGTIVSVTNTNPVKIRFNTSEEALILLDIFDASGRLLYTESHIYGKGENFSMLSGYPLDKGCYILRFRMNNIPVESRRFVVL
ncbi:MAG: redoxin domain-containing protein [Bacteroidota bacterium]